jgi:TonB family protein
MRKSIWFMLVAAVSLASAAQQTAGNTPAPNIITVAPGVMAGNRISGQAPTYPAIAKAANIQGTVVLKATISRNGGIENLVVVSGPPMLQAAALDAVRTWQYKPYLLNGQPVDVETQINVIFSLPGPTPPPGVDAAENLPSSQSGAAEPGGDQPPEHPVTVEQVHELLELTGTAHLQKQMLDGMMPSLRQMMPPYVPPDVMDDFEKSLLGADMDDMMVHAYQRHLSTEDAVEVIAFYKTPAGQHTIATMPAIAKELQAGGQQLGQQVMMEVVERHRTEIEAAKKKYDQEHGSAPQN